MSQTVTPIDPATSLPGFLAAVASDLSGGMELRDYYDAVRASYTDLRDYFADLRAVYDARHPGWPRDTSGMDRWMRDNPGPAMRPVHPLAGLDELDGDGIPTGWQVVEVAPERPGMLSCEVCEAPLELAARGRPRRTCSDACRKELSRRRAVQ